MADDIRDKKQTTMNDESQRGVFWSFLQSINDDDKKDFLNSLSEEEKVNFVSSKEEFRVIFGREPMIDFPKGKAEFEKDVGYTGVKHENIGKRFGEFKDMFPRKKTIEGMKKAFDKKEGKTVQSISDLKKISNSKD